MFDVFWFRFPLFRSLFALVIGIYMQSVLQLSWQIITGMGILNFALFLMIQFKSKGFKKAVYGGMVLNGVLFICGITILKFEQDKFLKFNAAFHRHSKAYVRIENKTVSAKGNDQYVVALYIKQHNNQYQNIGSLLVKHITLPNSNLPIGTCIAIELNEIRLFNSPENPHEFDFAKYYRKKGIYGQIQLLNKNKILFVPNSESFKNLTINFQIYLRQLMLIQLPDNAISGVLLALIDGDDSLIPKNLLNAYAATGTLHVLAVSGMHVSLVYALIGFVLFWMDRPILKLSKLLIQLSLVWLYAILCGFSPSIVRAAIMISFHAIAIFINRPQHQLNALFITAFFMLFYSPQLLFDAGFQLSFCAVLGLLCLYDPIFKLWSIKNKFVIQVWKLSAASIAAQIATLPLSIYHFHQFPLLFLPANILVIPIFTLCIYWGLFLVFIPNLPAIFWHILASIIKAVNAISIEMAGLKFAKIEQLYLNETASIFLAFFIVMALCALQYKSVFYLKTAICLVTFIQVITMHENYSVYKQRTIRLYAYYNHPCIAVLRGSQAVLFTDAMLFLKKPFTDGLKLERNKSSMVYLIQNNNQKIRIQGHSFSYDFNSNNWIYEKHQINERKLGSNKNGTSKSLLAKNTFYEFNLY